MATFVGNVEYGAVSDVIDLSTVERKPLGGLKLIPRKTIPKATYTAMSDSVYVNRLIQLREALAGKPAVFIGVDDQTSDYFEAFCYLGIVRRMPINAAYPKNAPINFETEGL